MISMKAYGLVIKERDEILGICTNLPTDKDLWFKKVEALDNDGEDKIITLFKDGKAAIRSFNARAKNNCFCSLELADELEASLGIKIRYRGTTVAAFDFHSIKPFVKAEEFEVSLERR